jgi:predicted AlkP superfamily phosphohydrolase/phosphomutase
MDEIEAKLLALRDHATGLAPVSTIYRTAEYYHGAHVSDAPDMVVGFSRTYGASDSSALGSLDRPIIKDRVDPWSGNHLMEASTVPGILLANRPVAKRNPDLRDMAPTILAAFGIEPTPEMTGQPVLAESE